jgi:hypothetical protein
MNLIELETAVQAQVDRSPESGSANAGIKPKTPHTDVHLQLQLLTPEYMPDIVRRLPPPFPGVTNRSVIVSDWPSPARLRITLTVRRNALPKVHSWYWAVESAVRIETAGMKHLHT